MSGRTRRNSIFDTIREANLAAGLALGRGSRRLSTLLTPQRLRTPTRLLIAPQDLRSSEATIAEDIFAGHLTFAGRRVDTGGRSAFEIAPPSEAFARELNGFGWLRHARAAESEDARMAARALVARWIALNTRTTAGPAFLPAVLGRRIISWITQSPLLLEGADEAFYRLFIKSLHRQATLLVKARRIGVAPADTLPALLALAYFALCADQNERLSRATVAALLVALRMEILPDGGHIGRNPQTLIDTLLDLLPLQQAFAARNLKLPPEIPSSIGRMIELLRLLRHADGALAHFNGMGVTEASQLASLLAYGGTRARPLLDASYSGYQRLQAAGAIALMDVGRTPPSRWSTSAHAGCLSLEFSARGARILINCGSPRTQDEAARQLARASAAHTTLVIADTSSARRIKRADGPLAGRLVHGPRDVSYGREVTESGETLIARHDGYARLFGLIHQRSIWLAADGGRLEGLDTLLAAGGRRGGAARQKTDASIPDFALRFHLHPSIRATLAADRQSVRLQGAADAIWVFEAPGQTLSIEDSISFAGRTGRQPCLQIVIEGQAIADAAIPWSLTQLS